MSDHWLGDSDFSYRSSFLFEERLRFAVVERYHDEPAWWRHEKVSESAVRVAHVHAVIYGPFSWQVGRLVWRAMREAALCEWHRAVGTQRRVFTPPLAHAVLTGITS